MASASGTVRPSADTAMAKIDLEKMGQERWGKEDGYRVYVSRTPVLVPRLWW